MPASSSRVLPVDEAAPQAIGQALSSTTLTRSFHRLLVSREPANSEYFMRTTQASLAGRLYLCNCRTAQS
jgi:hypothetical protein